MDTSSLPWAVILAGGEGTRLRALTARITGDARPKQFCPLFENGETPFDRTAARAQLLTRSDRLVAVTTRQHEKFYPATIADLAPGRLVVQPDNRGTAAAILYALVRVDSLAGDELVAVLPADHHVSDEVAFVRQLQDAVDAVQA